MSIRPQVHIADLFLKHESCEQLFSCRSIDCEDIDECARNSGKGDCDYECANSAGSFRCSCAAGFYLGTDGLTCHDINECEIHNGNCSQKCVNTPGNHSCSCFDGYVNSGPNGTDVICIDIGKIFSQYMSLVFSFLLLFMCVFFGHLFCLFFISFVRSLLVYLHYQADYQTILQSLCSKFIVVAATFLTFFSKTHL